MLEVRDLLKVYKPKKGVPVTALNHINIRFPDKGMVFLLGKSGSGKSTLLNLLGGLDTYTSGEILIKGVSSKAFKQKHFDSYRNTYVGFIFQEYNILEEFTVGANIALALELQGQKATDERLNEIMQAVDLDGFGHRKPNELSGGQKQRVAIARALIKNPEIIMADEPTGALDSNTGKQVFDTLKKLSKDKLVIIVSHDREFSEQYADRIIELADGNIISDVEIDANADENVNETESSETVNTLFDAEGNEITVSKELSFNGNAIAIEAGYHLTEEDRKAINAYMDSLERKETMILTKKVHRYRDVKFKDTDESKIAKHDGSSFHLIKSKLPMRNAFAIGASSLGYKKFRLVMTVLLSCIAFLLFGMADTFASYNNITACTQSLIDSGINYMSVDKQLASKTDDGKWNWNSGSYKMSEEDRIFVQDKLGIEMKGVYVPSTAVMTIKEYDSEVSLSEGSYCSYMTSFSGFAELTENELSSFGCKLVAGKMPDGTKNEIAISSYALETFKKAGYSATHENYETIRNASDMVGKTLIISDVVYTVTGVVDTGVDFSRYAALNEDITNASQAKFILSLALNQELRYTLEKSLTGTAMVGKGFVEKMVAAKPQMNQCNSSISFTTQVTENMSLWCSAEEMTTISEVKRTGMGILWLNGERTELADGEVIISAKSLDCDEATLKDFVAKGEPIRCTNSQPNEDGSWTDTELMVVGFFNDLNEDAGLWKFCIVANDDMIAKNCAENSSENDNCVYTYLVGGMPKSFGGVKAVVEFCETSHENDDATECVLYSLQNPVTYELGLVNSVLKVLARVVLFIGLGFAIFASIMLANFIATSINYKKQEIGILRAIGSRGNDVFRIFFSESFIIAMINFVVSTVGVIALTMLVNHIIRANTGILITVLNFGIRQVLLLLGVSILVAALASFFPVKRIAAKRPIDAIRNR